MEFTAQTALTDDVQPGRALSIKRYLHDAGRPSVRHASSGRRATRASATATGRLRAGRRRVPHDLVAERDEHRRPEVLPRPARLAGARALGQADDRPRRRHDRRLGPRARLLRDARGRRRLRGRAHLHPAPPDGGLQLPGLVQRRASRSSRSARPASSSASRTRWTRSSTGTPRRARSSAAARARASTSRTSAARWSR